MKLHKTLRKALSITLITFVSLMHGQAFAYCFAEAAKEYNLSEQLLRKIVIVESAGNNAATNNTHVKRTGSYDIGLMQINSRWLKTPVFIKNGLTEEALRNDACLNLKTGSWILAETLKQHGYNWNGVGAYNAACTELKGPACEQARQKYAWAVYKANAINELPQGNAPTRQAVNGTNFSHATTKGNRGSPSKEQPQPQSEPRVLASLKMGNEEPSLSEAAKANSINLASRHD
jgi:hypothetical protein